MTARKKKLTPAQNRQRIYFMHLMIGLGLIFLATLIYIFDPNPEANVTKGKGCQFPFYLLPGLPGAILIIYKPLSNFFSTIGSSIVKSTKWGKK